MCHAKRTISGYYKRFLIGTNQAAYMVVRASVAAVLRLMK